MTQARAHSLEVALVLVVSALLAASGCGTDRYGNREDRTAKRKVAPVTEKGFTYATEREDGVRVTVLRDTWPGVHDISEHVTPVKIRIDNDSGKPLRVSYDNLELEGTWGRDFDAVVYDPEYYVTTYTYWADTELPTALMLSKAIPEGVVNSGGSVEGFVFFKHMDTTTDKVVDLELDSVNTKTGERFGRVEVDFELDRYWG